MITVLWVPCNRWNHKLGTSQCARTGLSLPSMVANCFRKRFTERSHMYMIQPRGFRGWLKFKTMFVYSLLSPRPYFKTYFHENYFPIGFKSQIHSCYPSWNQFISNPDVDRWLDMGNNFIASWISPKELLRSRQIFTENDSLDENSTRWYWWQGPPMAALIGEWRFPCPRVACVI